MLCRCLAISASSFYSNQWFTTLFTWLLWAAISFHLPFPGIVSYVDVSFLTTGLYAQVLQLFLPFHNTDFPEHSHSQNFFPHPSSSHISASRASFSSALTWPGLFPSDLLRNYQKNCRLSPGYPMLCISRLPSFFLLLQMYVTCIYIKSPWKWCLFCLPILSQSCYCWRSCCAQMSYLSHHDYSGNHLFPFQPSTFFSHAAPYMGEKMPISISKTTAWVPFQSTWKILLCHV